MSPTTAVRDRGAKRLAYFQIADLQHYVLLSSGQYCLEIFSAHRPGEWAYRRYCDDSAAWSSCRASMSACR